MLRRPEEVADGDDVPELVIRSDGREPRQRVPDSGRLRVLLLRPAEHPVVRAVRFAALEDVVAPRDVVLVEQVGEVGPGVLRRRSVRLGLARRCHGRRVRIDAAHRIAAAGASRGPLRNREQVGGQAPRRVRLEHVILENEVSRVRPVVRDLARVVVAHDVDPVRRQRARRIVLGPAGVTQRRPFLRDETVHQTVVDVANRAQLGMRAADVAVVGVVERLEAGARLRVERAHERLTAVHRDSVGAGERPEVGVERAVLLHDDHDVLDLVHPLERHRPGTRRAV